MRAPEQASRPTVHRAAAVPRAVLRRNRGPIGCADAQDPGQRATVTGRRRAGAGRPPPRSTPRCSRAHPGPDRRTARIADGRSRPRWPPTRVTVRSTRPTSPPRWAAITTVRPSSHGVSSARSAVLAGGVEVGGGLVEQDHGHVAQHGPADGDALALAGAEGQAALADRGREPVGQPFHQSVQPGALEGLGDLGRRWRRGCPSRRLSSSVPRTRSGAGGPRPPVGATRAASSRPGDRSPTDTPPRLGHHEPEQHDQQRRLAGARLAHHRHVLARAASERSTPSRTGCGRPGVAGPSTSASRSGCRCRVGERAGRRSASSDGVDGDGVGVVQDVEDAGGRRPALGAGVELGAGPAQRQVDLGGQDQDGQGRAQGERAVEQAQAEEERHQGRAHRGHRLEGQRREEGHLEGGHGLVVELPVGPLEGVAGRPRSGRRPAGWAGPGAGRRRWRPGPDSRAHWRSAFRVASRPRRIMNRGMTATVTARMTAENQSRTTMQARSTTGVSAARTSGREVPGEVAVEGVDPWVAEAASSPVRSPASHDGPRVTARVSSWRRRVEVTWADVRWAATSPAQALTARTAEGRRRGPPGAGTVRADARVVDQDLLDDRTEQDGLGDQRRRADEPDDHGARPGSGGWPGPDGAGGGRPARDGRLGPPSALRARRPRGRRRPCRRRPSPRSWRRSTGVRRRR